jgi:hypothetical protein
MGQSGISFGRAAVSALYRFAFRPARARFIFAFDAVRYTHYPV